MRRYYCLFLMIVMKSGIVIYAQQWTKQDSIWLLRVLNGTEKIQLNEETRKAIESGTLIHDPTVAKQLIISPKEFPVIESFEGITTPEFNRKLHVELAPPVYRLYLLNHKYLLPDGRRATIINVATIDDLKMLDAVTARKATVDDPFTIRSGGGSFDFEDILRTIFWPSHRAKKRNAQHANAWKTYNTEE